MAHKAIREADGKRMLARLLKDYSNGKYSLRQIRQRRTRTPTWQSCPSNIKWLTTEKLVVKPDQLIKRRGKNKLILVDATYAQAKAWIKEKSKAPTTVYGSFDANGKPVGKGTVGQLTNFIIEPLTPHKEADECYIAITSKQDGDTILFHHRGRSQRRRHRRQSLAPGSTHRHTPQQPPKSKKNSSQKSPANAKNASQASSKRCSSSTPTSTTPTWKLTRLSSRRTNRPSGPCSETGQHR